MVWAGRGLGAWFNGTPCRVSSTSDLEGAALSTSAFELWDVDMLERARKSEMLLRTWGDGYGYLLVATGRIDAMVDPVVNYWDIAPCEVIIPEAGGRLSTIDGDDDVTSGSALATNGGLHDAVVDMLTGRAARPAS
jgi:fructose-1,6-bisphosphatase/inositol monophosphatase family enzyme